MSMSLAVKYRPTSFNDLTEQGEIVKILTNQITTNTIQHGYLFCGGAGTGKTTSARIFASMINKGQGTPIELDAASNNSVDDIRRLTDDAQTQSLDSEYKVYIIDECHSLSSQAWQAFLKTLEEPPAKSIFILCTTNPEKIPSTILSRVQRYNFQRISYNGVMDRLFLILEKEQEINNDIDWEATAVDYIAKVADGGMRDAITLMDKCLSYSPNLSLDNVLSALGLADYDTMFVLNECLMDGNSEETIKLINEVFNSGIDLKLFVKMYFEFVLDCQVYHLTKNMSNTKIPQTWKSKLDHYNAKVWATVKSLLQLLVNLVSEIKWETNAKSMIIARFVIFCEGEK